MARSGLGSSRSGHVKEQGGRAAHHSFRELTAITMLPFLTPSGFTTLRPPPLLSFYNSGTTGPIGTNEAPSGGTILSAVSKMVTSGDLSDPVKSHDRCRLWQSFYNSGTAGDDRDENTTSRFSLCDFISRFEYGDLR